VLALHQWSDPIQDAAWSLVGLRWIDEVISPASPGGPFPCFLEREEGRERIKRTFGPENFERLERMRDKWDPTCVFWANFWPRKVGI